MRKDEFISKVQSLKRATFYKEDHSWEKDNAFDECKNAIITMACELDVDGMSMESLKIVRDTLNETATVYSDLIKTQKELYDARKEIAKLQEEIFEMEKRHNNELPQRYDDIIPNKIYEVNSNENN